MKKLIFSTGIVFLLSLAAFAQRAPHPERPTPEMHAKKMTERLDKELNLSEEQKEKIMQINLENAKMHEEMKQVREEESIQRMKEHHQKIQEVLTEEQRQKMVELEESIHPRKHRMHGPGGPRGGEIHDADEFREKLKKEGN